MGVLVFFIACKQTPTAETGDPSSIPGVTTTQMPSASEETQAFPPSQQELLKKKKRKGPEYDPKEWVEIIESDEMTKLDIRYATENNFTKKQIYDCARCFLRPEVGKQLLGFREHMINKYKLGIILYDCYRPRPYQQKLWDIVPDERYVGNPAKGSMHNRGMAIDIGLIDSEGNILDMGTEFDHFGEASFHSATNISKEAIENRKLLKKEMGLYGFKPITSEWWHYSYRKNVKELSDWVWECN